MTFTFACRECGQDNLAELAWSGRTIHCAGCGSKVVVPAPRESNSSPEVAAATVVSASAQRFSCPDCGRRYAAKPDLAGKSIRCGGCGSKVRVPGTAEPVAPSRPVLKSIGGSLNIPGSSEPKAGSVATSRRAFASEPAPAGLDLFDIAVSGNGERAASAKGLPLEAVGLPIPKRKRQGDAQDEEIESVLPSRTEAIEELRQSLAEKAAKVEKERPKKKKKRKRSSGGLEMSDVYNLIVFALGTVFVVGGLSWAYEGLRFPMGGLLALCGFILYLLGTYGFSQVAKEEGIIYSLMCRFVPLYKWYFLYSRWDLMKNHSAFLAAGMILLSSGGALVKFSPVGREVEAAEKAYAKKLKKEEADAEARFREVIPGRAAPALRGESQQGGSPVAKDDE